MKTGTINCDAYTQEKLLPAASTEAIVTLRYWFRPEQSAQNVLRQHESSPDLSE